MEKDYSISGLTNELKKIAKDIKDAIANKGILDEENVKDDLSLFSGYITDTIIGNFENTLETTFNYPSSIVEYIYKRFSYGGYVFYDRYQKKYVEEGDIKEQLEKIVIPDNSEIRRIFRESTITDDNGVEWNIAYFPILNLTEFGNEIKDLFKNNRIVIGLPKIIYDGEQVTTLAGAFSGCTNLHDITLKAVNKKSYVPLNTQYNGIFKNCIVLEDFKFENIAPTNISELAKNNDINVNALERLDLTHVTTANNLVYTPEKSTENANFIPNLNMPRCKKAKGMLVEGRRGCGNLTFGVGCEVDVHTFGKVGYSPNVGIISGLTSGVDLTKHSQYNAQSVHNWLYSVATDVRTYDHPSESGNVRILTFNANAKAKYESEMKTDDETNIVYIQDTLTVENTLNFSVEDNELNSLNDAISSSTSLKKPLELYDAIYNKNNNTRYYITALNDGVVTTFHKCTFELVEDKDENGKTVQKARLAEGTIFNLMELRNWAYE